MDSFLLGTWRLIAWERPRAPATVPAAFVGRLTYAPEGRMSVVIHAEPRPRAASDNPLDATDDELRAAARGAVAYAGRWRLRGAEDAWMVEHQVDASLHPNWIAGPDGPWQRRALRVLSPSDMALSAGPEEGDRTTLRWRRLLA